MRIQDKLGQYVRVKQPFGAPVRAILRGIRKDGLAALVQDVHPDDDRGIGQPYVVEIDRVHWQIPFITPSDIAKRKERRKAQKEAWGYGYIDLACPTRIYSCHPGYNTLPEIYRDTCGLGNMAIIEISTERRILTRHF